MKLTSLALTGKGPGCDSCDLGHLMQFSPRSPGLFFADDDLQIARDNLARDPIRAAVELLDAQRDDPLETAHLAALRYRLRGDSDAGRSAVETLRQADFAGDLSTDLTSMQRALGWLSVIAMLRDHPAWRPLQAALLPAIESQVEQRNLQGATGAAAYWLGALNMAAGILLESAPHCERGANSYRQAVDAHIHPEGYLRGIVDKEGAEQTYEMQLSATCALVLLAEMAGQVGLDLWAYDNRAVTVNTAATYTYYYYYFPEKWRWEAGLTRARTLAAMRREGAFIELVNRRHPLNGIEQLFEEQRPFFCACGGGLTTLTHGFTPPKHRRWRLW